MIYYEFLKCNQTITAEKYYLFAAWRYENFSIKNNSIIQKKKTRESHWPSSLPLSMAAGSLKNFLKEIVEIKYQPQKLTNEKPFEIWHWKEKIT